MENKKFKTFEEFVNESSKLNISSKDRENYISQIIDIVENYHDNKKLSGENIKEMSDEILRKVFNLNNKKSNDIIQLYLNEVNKYEKSDYTIKDLHKLIDLDISDESNDSHIRYFAENVVYLIL
jgi:hypothetical protein